MWGTGKAFQDFLNSCRADLRRIAWSSRGEYSVDDLCSEAWLISDEIGRKRGFAVDLSNGDDRRSILARLYNKLIRFAEKNIRFAVRLDKDWDSNDSDYAVNRLARLLAAPEDFDPLIRMQADEDQPSALQLVKHSYSQASAYVILLDRFDWEQEVLARYLNLAVSALRRRMIASGTHMKYQPSLFDRILSVEHDFVPMVARRAVSDSFPALEVQQLEWEFP